MSFEPRTFNRESSLLPTRGNFRHCYCYITNNFTGSILFQSKIIVASQELTFKLPASDFLLENFFMAIFSSESGEDKSVLHCIWALKRCRKTSVTQTQRFIFLSLSFLSASHFFFFSLNSKIKGNKK